MVDRTIQPAQLEKYALAEKWAPIDKAFSRMNSSQFEGLLAFARKELSRDDGNLQDLGATIFQNYAKPLKAPDVKLLTRVIQNPGNEFAKYRAGFALWKCGYRSEEVRKVIEEAQGCGDVADIARDLLKAT